MKKYSVILFLIFLQVSSISKTITLPAPPSTTTVSNITIVVAEENASKALTNLVSNLLQNNNTKNHSLLKTIYYGLGGSTASAYIFNFFKLHQTNKLINSNKTWSSWKINLTLEQLSTSSKEELKQELQQDTQRFYKESFSINYMLDLKEDLLNERTQLKEYLSKVETLKKYHLSFLFPIKEANIKLAHAKLNKISFILGLL